MAQVIAGENLKDLVSIKLKTRYDNFADQFHRILVVKLFLVCSFVMGFSWFTDSISCIVPESAQIDPGYVSAACWIQGVFIYRDLSGMPDESAYYGLPMEINKNGLTRLNNLCQSYSKVARPRRLEKPKEECFEMEKTFYLQYQYMPFYVAGLAIFYFLPYMFYMWNNSDLKSLRDSIKDDKSAHEKAGDIAEHYFSDKKADMRTYRVRAFMNVICKLMYIVVGLVAFIGTDKLLNEDFIPYGQKWMKWSSLNNTNMYNYMGMRNQPKPGNVLLPPFGYCEVWESAMDRLTDKNNKHKFVCELSQNILYQYCLFVMWWLMVIGLLLSVLGLLWLLLKYTMKGLKIRRWNSPSKQLYNNLTIREMEYLDFIKQKDIPLYDLVMEELKNNPEHEFSERAPERPAKKMKKKKKSEAPVTQEPIINGYSPASVKSTGAYNRNNPRQPNYHDVHHPAS